MTALGLRSRKSASSRVECAAPEISSSALGLDERLLRGGHGGTRLVHGFGGIVRSPAQTLGDGNDLGP